MWCPDWPLGRPDAPSDETVLVIGAPDRGASRVVAASQDAYDVGVELGMPRREAEGLCPGAVVLDQDPGEETRRFESIVELLSELIPRVEVSEPGLVFIPVAGAIRYYGGEASVVDMIHGKLDASGIRHCLGLADGPFAAYWAARRAQPDPLIITDTASFLADLDVATLGHDDLIATFRWLGVDTLGSLANLPREAIASRFGPVGLQAHRLAHGEDRMVAPQAIPPEAAVEMVFEDPLFSIDQLAFAAKQLAARLISELRTRGAAPYRISVVIEGTDGVVRDRVWRSADPFTEAALADRVWWQLRAWTESDRGSKRGIVRLKLDPSDLSDDGRQLNFFVDESSRIEAERAFARIQTLVGPDAVLQAVPQGGRMPDEQVAWHRWGEETVVARPLEAPWPGAMPAGADQIACQMGTGAHLEWAVENDWSMVEGRGGGGSVSIGHVCRRLSVHCRRNRCDVSRWRL